MDTPSTDNPVIADVPPLGWELVPIVWDYYDIPLGGLAHLNGVPHLFDFLDDERVPDPEDPEEFLTEDIYALYPVSEDLVALLVEKSDIFERWHKAWSADQSLMKQHPALAADRARYDELKAITAERIKAVKETTPRLLKKGYFSRGRRPVEPGHSAWTSYGVRWSDYVPAPTEEQA